MNEAETDTPETLPDRGPWAWILGTVGFLGFAFFAVGYGAMDSIDPDTSTGTAFYLFTLLFGVAAIAVAVVMRPTETHVPLIVGSVGALLGGLLFAAMAEDGYNGAFGFGVMVFILPSIVIGYGTTLLILGLTRRIEGLREACTTWGITMASGAGVAAAYHLATLDTQTRLAREAHEAPGVGVAAVLLAVLVLLAARRHSR